MTIPSPVHNTILKLTHHPFSIDYFGDLSHLVITIPSKAHELVATNAQHTIRQSLFDQSFYWPEWGGVIDRIECTGSADRKLTRAGHNPSLFQPDGSLNLAGVDLPFLIIEVADTESYKHARTKSKSFLMGSKGQTRFVILIDLIRKSAKEMKESALGEPESDAAPQSDGSDDGLGGESLPAQPFPEGNKRAAQDNDDLPEIKKRTRTTSPEQPPASPTLPPLPRLTPYSRATVTVLTTRIIANPKRKGRKLLKIFKLIDEAECWPALPAQDVYFTFSWEDMDMEDYPVELRDSKFTIRFEWLNELLQRHFGGFKSVPRARDHTGDDSVDEDESELDEEDVAMERERVWAVEAKVDSGKVESDDSWK